MLVEPPAFGLGPSELPDGLLDATTGGVPPLRHGRRVWDAQLPLDDLASAAFPVVVVGGGHEVQGTGDPFNSFLLEFWRSVDGS